MTTLKNSILLLLVMIEVLREELSNMDEVVVNDSTLDDTDLMLTTIDNPFSPKDNYEQWRNWDEDNGYYTEQFVARLLLMEEEYDVEDDVKTNELTNKVINEILEHDMLNVYMLV